MKCQHCQMDHDELNRVKAVRVQKKNGKISPCVHCVNLCDICLKSLIKNNILSIEKVREGVVV